MSQKRGKFRYVFSIRDSFLQSKIFLFDGMFWSGLLLVAFAARTLYSSAAWRLHRGSDHQSTPSRHVDAGPSRTRRMRGVCGMM